MNKIISFLAVIFISINCYASDCRLASTDWSSLCKILQNRVNQTKQKMKLSPQIKDEFEEFLLKSKEDFPHIKTLKNILPKTSLELLMGIRFREVDPIEAEKIAQYIREVAEGFDFENPGAFDENTSHIIGRYWNEIDYTGEGMTWQKQKQNYMKYNITNFRTFENIQKFFPVESKLPYFKKIYKARNKGYKL